MLPFGIGSAPAAHALAAPDHTITIGGSGVTTWPVYAPEIDRYAVRPDETTGGDLTVTASTSDPAGTILVNGRPVASGDTTAATGLDIGDEINVSITDRSGTTSQSFIYLAPGFPAMTATSAGAGPTPGYVFLALRPSRGGPNFEAVVDRFGVPIYIRDTLNPQDLKLQPNGNFSVARGRTNALDSSFDIVELDPQFEPVASYTTQGLEDTEFHDSILEPSGGRILMAYEPNSTTGKIDSVVQDIGLDGTVALTWNSNDHVDPAVDGLTNLRDYAHLNSIDVMADNNLLLSFRHLSQVMKVDRTSGKVIWRLGGVRSDFTFPDDPSGGPCAQHTARELANGNIEMWDDGSKVTRRTLQPMCPDPADPTGPRVERPFSRVVEYRLDQATHTAHLVRQVLTGEFSEFAGSAQRLGGRTAQDNTMVGTADGHDPTTGIETPDALEVDANGNVVWSLSVPDYFSYRALKYPAPDAIDPKIKVTGMSQDAVYDEGETVPVEVTCSDRGGSNLQQCESPKAPDGLLDTRAGAHTLKVMASDGAGNTATRTFHYVVPANFQPDVEIKRDGGSWIGNDVLGGATNQRVEFTVSKPGTKKIAHLRVTNDGLFADKFLLTGTPGNKDYAITYTNSGIDVTAKIVKGALRTPKLKPGESYQVRVKLKRTPKAVDGTSRTARVEAVSVTDIAKRDAAAAKIIGN